MSSDKIPGENEDSVVRDFAPQQSDHEELACVLAQGNHAAGELCEQLRQALAARPLVFHTFAGESEIQRELLKSQSPVREQLAVGFDKLIVLDVATGRRDSDRFDLAAFYRYAFEQFKLAFDLPADHAFHEQDLLQILKDEQRSLLCLINADCADAAARKRLRSLTQEGHSSLIVFQAEHQDEAPITSAVRIKLFEGKQELWDAVCKVPLEIGRQQEGDTGPLELQDHFNHARLVIAPVSARAIPRQALRVEVSSDGQLQLTNIHPRLSFYVGRSETLGPGETVWTSDEIVVALPQNRTVLASLIRRHELKQNDPKLDNFETLREVRDDFDDLGSLDAPVDSAKVDNDKRVEPVRLNELFEEQSSEDQGRIAVDLVRSALTVIQHAVGSDQFYESAVHAVATMVELDRAMVLMRLEDDWEIRASFSMTGEESNADSFSRGLTDRVDLTRATAIYGPANYFTTVDYDLILVEHAIASPIFDNDRKVIGILYGDRRLGSGGSDTPIGDLEAALVEVMADAVSAGLARQRQDEVRSTWTQFFSTEIADRLDDDQDLLVARDSRITVMSCGIDAFHVIAECAGTKRTVEWLNDVLTELSLCVTNNHGVVVEYFGNQLMAMWGAPADQPDHAARACRAAVEMTMKVESLAHRWKEITPEAFGVRIGIHTGVASVGNIGSKVKFKYGPLGETVDLARQVQAMTGDLGASVLITDSTADEIGREFELRRQSNDSIGLHELRAAK